MIRLALLLGLALSVSCFLQIYAPQQLVDKFKNLNGNRIPYSTANFGVIPYGKQMMGKVVLANPLTNCDFEQDIADETVGVKQNTFILALRGDCSFVKKVHNAQEEGASLAIIMDDRVEKTERIVMANDGQGSHLKIPSIFVNEADGEMIVQWTTSFPDKPVILSVKFQTNVTDEVQVSLWLDANSRSSYRFVRDFKPLYEKVSSQLNFTVYYYSFPCYEGICESVDCYGGYDYCQIDPDGPLPANGRTLLDQQLREFFVLQQYPAKWWDYVLLIDDHCGDYASLEACSNQQLTKLSISPADIQKLVKDQALITQILQYQAQKLLASGVMFFPDVTINQIPYLGQLDGIDVFEMICNSLNSPPSDCNSFVYDPDKIVPVPAPQNHVAMIVTIVSVSLVVFFLFMVCIYRRFIRRRLSRQMNSHVNQLVSQYITLFEEKRIEQTADAPST